MNWLLPSALAVGGVAALVVTALHFIARSEPRPEPFPTARFVPDRPLRARARTLALSDLVLLAVRLAALAALAVGVAGPVYAARRGRVLRVIAVDRSRAAGSAAEVRDSARALARTGDVLLTFDTTASLVMGARDLDSLALSRAPGSLSVALAASIGMAARLADRADSIELVVVSPFMTDELDAATERVRATWRGRTRLVRVPPARIPPFQARVQAIGSTDDPVVAALALVGARAPGGAIRLTRGTPTVADSAFARADGHVLIHWPATDAADWPARTRVDTVGAVVAGRAVVVAPFPRRWIVQGTPVARWVDGEPAAADRLLEGGCIRDVAIPLDAASDLTLRPPFRALLQSLLVPCDGARSPNVLSAAQMASLRGPATASLVAASWLRDPRRASPFTLWLVALGAVLLIVELGVRRVRAPAA